MPHPDIESGYLGPTAQILMSYFSDNYERLMYPTIDSGRGLYNAQIGAIHEIASHFTLHATPAIVTMPTGSGKTAVLIMTPYALRAERVLVVTPSRLVREQIAEDFRVLATLTDVGALPADTPRPRLHEQRSRLRSNAAWEALSNFDVVVGNTNCISPGHPGVPPPPADFFDLILVDEAHHSPAHTWATLFDAFPNAKRVLFTATPFRRDRREIVGRFAYSYPLHKAYEDRIFGQIQYVPVDETETDQDLAVARKAEEVLLADRRAGFNHMIMVRTDRRRRAKELLEMYAANTSLRLALIHSGLSQRTVSQILGKLRSGELDGVVCVNMMGEGFNFPHLKIAAIHAPHKSLEVTLQFIGRFTRTNAADIGSAKFVAARSELEIEGQRFFDEASVWHKIIINLSEGRIGQEVQLREALDRFEAPMAEEDLSDLSLYSLYPRSHVKIYDAPPDMVLPARLTVAGADVVYESTNDTHDTVVFIVRSKGVPKWLDSDRLIEISYDLYVVYHDREHALLFINASKSREGMYAEIVDAIGATLAPLRTGLIRRVIKDFSNPRVFNLGMRNILATNQAESYKIIAGGDAQANVKPSDSLIYRQGHVFMSGEERGEKTTVGYSTLSKVWATAQLQVPHLADWCKELGAKIRSLGEIVTNSGLDYLSPGDVVTTLPDDIIVASWPHEAFDYGRPVEARYLDDSGASRRLHISDLEIAVLRDQSTADLLVLEIRGDKISVPIEFTLSEGDDFFRCPDDDDRIRMSIGTEECSLIEYLNEHPLDFYTASGALMRLNELFAPKADVQPIDARLIDVWDWTGVDIKQEVRAGALQSIHAYLRAHLSGLGAPIVLYDHGTGEIADFVTIRREATALIVSLYHCKGSAEATPGARLQDVIEVCSQAQKSTPWRNPDSLRRKLMARKVEYVVGTREDLIALLAEAKILRLELEVVVVQPGISKSRLSNNLAQCLGATNDHLMQAACKPLKVVASA